jgi:uncharacterized protein YjiK
LTATPNTGYEFVNWTQGGVEVSTNPTYSFTVVSDSAFVANFDTISYTITATGNPAEGGVVTGGGSYKHFTTATLTATANEGYTFVKWTKGGSLITTNPTYSFMVTEDGDYVAHFSLNSYEITVDANPVGGGTVDGAGTYNHGASATLTATANTGYHFVNWTKGEDVVSTNASYTFTVTEAAAYVANFELNSYAITATANPVAGGAVDGAGTYNHGAEVTLTATPNEGYTFVSWMKSGSVVSYDASFTIAVTEAADYVANFSLNSYEITVAANPNVGGTVTGEGFYNHGQTATLTATPNTGYLFSNWTKNGAFVSNNATYSFTVTGAGNYVANFTEMSTVATPTFSPEPGTYYDALTVSLLCATTGADIHYTTDGTIPTAESTVYTGAIVLAVGDTTVINAIAMMDGMTNSEMATATYILLPRYDVVISDAIVNGTVTASAVRTPAGTIVHLTATPATGYHFGEWNVTSTLGAVTVTNNTFVMPAANVLVSANFEPTIYTINVVANPEDGGTVTGAGEYTYGQSVTLTATPAEGYTFFQWVMRGVVISTEAEYTFPATAGGTCIAYFTQNNYTINASANPTAGGTVSGAGEYTYGQNASLMATANTGYHFINWTKDGDEVSTNATYIFMVTESGDYVANFEPNTYTINASANPTAGGTVTGAGNYTHGQNVTLTAIPAEGYTFVNWTKNGVVITPSATYTFTVTANGDYVANFALNSYEITVTADPTEGGTVTGGGTYNHGEMATLTATPNTGYHFVSWNDGNADNPRYVEVVFSTNFIALFDTNSYNITATASPAAGGTVSGGGSYKHFTTATLTATANEGYTFTNWTKGGEVVSTNANYSFTVTEAADYVANFTLSTYTLVVSANPEEGGTVTGSGTYTHGQTATLTATPNEGYHFVHWNDGSISNPRQVTVTNNNTFIAIFELNSYEITATANPAAGGMVSGAGTYNYGQTATLTATANAGYEFTNWTKNGAEVSTNATYSFTVMEAGDYVANFTAMGTVATPTFTPEAGTYNVAQNVTITCATAGATIYYTVDGTEPTTSSAVYESAITVSETATLKAFAVKAGMLNSAVATATYTIVPLYSITIDGTIEHGTVTASAATAEAGATITLTATPATGYHFGEWHVTSALGDVTVTGNSFIMPAADVTVSATFEPNSYTITATANPAAGGTVSGAGTYSYGATATLTAAANAGYLFTNWTKNGAEVSTNASYSFTVTEAGDYVANFTAMGTVATPTFTPAAGTYNVAQNVTITCATAGATIHYTVDGTEPSTSSAVYESAITVSETATLKAIAVKAGMLNSAVATATYTIVPLYSITVDGTIEHGTVTASAATAEAGATITLTATPATGYHFGEWHVTSALGDVMVTNNSFVMPAANVTVSATFEPNNYVLTYMDGEEVLASETYEFGAAVTPIEDPVKEGYAFMGWEPEVPATMPDSDVTVYAQWQAIVVENYTITVNVGDETPWGTVTGSGTFAYGAADTLVATPFENYVFAGWSDNSIDNPRVITVTQDSTITAYFIPEEIVIPVNDSLAGTVDVIVPEHATLDSLVTITAVPEPHYHFVSWSDGNTENPRTVTVREALVLTAIFAIDQHTITVLSNDENMGTVSVGGTYDYGTEISISADAREGYRFVMWNDSNTDNPRTIVVEQDITFIAYFEVADGIHEVDENNINIYSYDNQIFVVNAEGLSVEIFDMSGRLIVSESRITTSERNYTIYAPGIYLVKVGESVVKKVTVLTK